MFRLRNTNLKNFSTVNRTEEKDADLVSSEALTFHRRWGSRKGRDFDRNNARYDDCAELSIDMWARWLPGLWILHGCAVITKYTRRNFPTTSSQVRHSKHVARDQAFIYVLDDIELAESEAYIIKKEKKQRETFQLSVSSYSQQICQTSKSEMLYVKKDLIHLEMYRCCTVKKIW